MALAKMIESKQEGPLGKQTDSLWSSLIQLTSEIVIAFHSTHLISISSYSRLYSGMVALRKLASQANSKHLPTKRSL